MCVVLQVMLLANPGLEELYHKSCALAEDPQELRDAFQHPARLIKVQLTLVAASITCASFVGEGGDGGLV